MKLQAQYNRVTIISTIFILLLAGAGYYFLLRYVLTSQLDEALIVEEVEIYDHVKQYKSLPPSTVYKDQRISFEPTDKPGRRSFQSISIFNADDGETESARQLLFPLKINNQDYMVSVTKSAESTKDLVGIILISIAGLIVLLTVILFFTNRFLLKKLWQPFRNTLSSIKEFNLSAPIEMSIQPTRINEFRELNDSISVMARKVTKDYQALRDFTDQASHEMQTPLAIINSKLDVLIQEPDLSEKSMRQLESIYKPVEKLSRLCQSLLLLARIGNNQYAGTHQVAMNDLLEEKIRETQEWMSTMSLHLDTKLEPLPVSMNRELAEILTSNLFSNAIRHNKVGGTISIATNQHKLWISNTGKSQLDKTKVFNRFNKSDHSDGSGLGLAIVKQICDQYHFTISYSFEKDQHVFSVLFRDLQPAPGPGDNS
ncbi:MAG: HAMP domain-containing sensor histidine kinase [Chitinophagaceae bacterium]